MDIWEVLSSRLLLGCLIIEKLVNVSPLDLLRTTKHISTKSGKVWHSLTKNWHRIDTEQYSLTQNDSNVQKDVLNCTVWYLGVISK